MAVSDQPHTFVSERLVMRGIAWALDVSGGSLTTSVIS